MELIEVLFILRDIAEDQQNLRLALFRQPIQRNAQISGFRVRLDGLRCCPYGAMPESW